MARTPAPCELTASVVVAAPVQHCWVLYINNQIVPEWAPAVRHIEYSSPTITPRSSRKCRVEIDGKQGHTVEQCTLIDPLKRIEFSVTEETFGFSHMLNNYGFAVTFDVDSNHTLVVMKTHYTAKKIFASVMTAKATQQLLLRLMQNTLVGFKRYAERHDCLPLAGHCRVGSG